MKMLKIIRENKTIKDVLLMMELDFNPENWKVWKPQLKELFAIKTFKKEDSDDEDKVVYDKKQKLWSIQDIK